eukprot:407751-Heterocapsa_arctica.AAC.1
MEVDWLGKGKGKGKGEKGGQGSGGKVNYRTPGIQQPQAPRPLQASSQPRTKPPVVCTNCGGNHWA